MNQISKHISYIVDDQNIQRGLINLFIISNTILQFHHLEDTFLPQYMKNSNLLLKIHILTKSIQYLCRFQSSLLMKMAVSKDKIQISLSELLQLMRQIQLMPPADLCPAAFPHTCLYEKVKRDFSCAIFSSSTELISKLPHFTFHLFWIPRNRCYGPSWSAC